MPSPSERYNRILVVDDDASMRDSLVHLLGAAGWAVEVAKSAKDAIESNRIETVEVVLSDVRMPKVSGLDLLEQVVKSNDSPPVVLISAHGDIPMAVKAIQNGAYSFVEKPFDPHRLLRTLSNARAKYRLEIETKRLRARVQEMAGLEAVLPGDSDQIKLLRKQVEELDGTLAPVLIIGETGTCKAQLARCIHDSGRNTSSQYDVIQCAALSVDEFAAQEAELMRRRSGPGTLLLYQIDACPKAMQPRLLSLIERLNSDVAGGDPGVHIISTSKSDLKAEMASGAFRDDLYYRTSTILLRIPALRDRPDDIPLLHRYFLENLTRLYSVNVPPPTADDITRLHAYDWPGNIRELRNVVERQVLGAKRGDPSIASALAVDLETESVPPNLRGAVAALERELIAQAIKAHHGRMDATAEALGIGRRTLNEKIVKLGLDKSSLL